MTENKKDMFTVYSQKLAGTLMVKGFVLVAIEPHNDGSGRNVFYFNNSPELQKEVGRFSRGRR